MYEASLSRLLQGNYIGTDVTGSYAIPNEHGVGFARCNVLIGGTAPGAGNLISGNGGAAIAETVVLVQLEGNLIGTDERQLRDPERR